MSKRILETVDVNGVSVDIYTDGNDFFVEYNNTTKKISLNSYYMLDIYKDLDPDFSYLEEKDLHGEEFSNKEKEIYNHYIDEANRLRYLS